MGAEEGGGVDGVGSPPEDMTDEGRERDYRLVGCAERLLREMLHLSRAQGEALPNA